MLDLYWSAAAQLDGPISIRSVRASYIQDGTALPRVIGYNTAKQAAGNNATEKVENIWSRINPYKAKKIEYGLRR